MYIGELAQMVERSLSMREVPGSIPGFSILFLVLSHKGTFSCVLFFHCLSAFKTLNIAGEFSVVLLLSPSPVPCFCLECLGQVVKQKTRI